MDQKISDKGIEKRKYTISNQAYFLPIPNTNKHKEAQNIREAE